MTSDVEQRVLFAKRAKVLALQDRPDFEFDYVAEKMVPVRVSQGKEVASRGQFDDLRKITGSGPHLHTHEDKTNPVTPDADKGFSRPLTQSLGRRIYERKNNVTQNESKFQFSSKVFTNVKTDEEKRGLHRPPLNSYKREFAMPDYFHIEVPTERYSQTNVVRRRRGGEADDVNKSNVTPKHKEEPVNPADSLLSKHNGWITIDSENMNRK